MAQNTDFRTHLTERYLGWAGAWGLTLAFGITQSLEKAEVILGEAIAALMATDAEYDELPQDPRLTAVRAVSKTSFSLPKSVRSQALPPSVSAVRFATAIYDIGKTQAFRGFGADTFFKMPVQTRSVVVLKTKALFSLQQIALALDLAVPQVEDHLENARLLFSDGRPWLEAGPGIRVEQDRWIPNCPQWSTQSPLLEQASEYSPISEKKSDIQNVFAAYVGQDLDSEKGSKLHSHLLVCTTCRSSLAYFKNQYSLWVNTIPAIEPGEQSKKHFQDITKMALKLNRRRPTPSPWPGLKKLLGDSQLQTLLSGALILWIVYFFLHRT